MEKEQKLQEKQENKNQSYWGLKQRIVLSLLLSFTVSFMLFVFGPVSIYAKNSDEFQFVLFDFIGWNILLAFGVTAALFGLLMIFRKRVFDIVYAVLFAGTVLFFLQGNYLNFGMHSLGGDGETDFGVFLVIDTLIWAAVIALCVVGIILLCKKHRDIVRIISVVTAITLFGMQCISTVALGFSPESFPSRQDKVKDGKRILTYENLTNVSDRNNVLYFLVDRLDWRFCEEAEADNPEFFNSLDGFTLYDDAMSMYARTYPSVAYMLSGHEYNSEMMRKEYLDYAFRNSDYLKAFKNHGYNVNLYTDQYFVYEDASSMEEYVTNSANVNDYTITNPFGLGMKIVQISLYRYLPIFIKKYVPVSTSDFGQYVRYETEHYQLDMPKLYNKIGEEPFTTYSDRGNFSFIHMFGPHHPFKYDENFQPTVNGTVLDATKQSFKIINRYLNHMKEAGLYQDATIVITADHCGLDDEMKAPVRSQTIPIFFKKSGMGSNEQKNEPITRSSAPVCHANIFPEIYQSEGLPQVNENKSLSDIAAMDESAWSSVERKYIYQRQDGDEYDDWKFENFVYKVVGFAKDFNNWELVQSGEFVKNIYD